MAAGDAGSQPHESAKHGPASARESGPAQTSPTAGAFDKDLAEHIRLTHFSLVAGSVAVVIALANSTTPLRHELTAIRDITQNIAPATGRNGPLGSSLLETFVRQAFGPPGAGCIYGHVSVRDAGRVLVERSPLSVCLPNATIFSGNPSDTRAADGGSWKGRAYGDLSPGLHATWHAIPDVAPESEPNLLEDSAPGVLWFSHRETPATVQQFRSLWDNLGNLIHGYVRTSAPPDVHAFRVLSEASADSRGIHSVDSPLRNVGPIPDGSAFLEEVAVSWQLGHEDDPDFSETSRLIVAKSRTVTYSDVYETIGTDEFRRTAFAFARPGGTEVIPGLRHQMIPLKHLAPGDLVLTFSQSYDHVVFDFQAGLLERAGHVGRPVGSFSVAFPAMTEFVKQYGDVEVPLDVLSVDVEREIQRGDGPVEILGLKIERTSIASWGAGILVGIQLYFVSHLREWRRRHVQGQADIVPWIGFYRGFLPRFLLLASAIVLPAVAAVLAWRRALAAGETFAELATVLLFVGIAMTSVVVVRISFTKASASK